MSCRKTRRAPRIGELGDLPLGPDLEEHEGIDAAVAERVVAMKRVIRPDLGNLAVDSDLRVPDALVPDITGGR